MALSLSLKIGLTGGIGCGKSTVVEYFDNMGWRTIKTDEIVHRLLAANSQVHTALRERWADVVFTEDGHVDRQAIANYVFNDDGELSWLEQLLHPLVRDSWECMLANEPNVNWLVEIPLLFEKNLETCFDFTVCIVSPPDIVKNRMAHRGHLRIEIERRRSKQMPLAEKISRGDYVIFNAGSFDFLKRQTMRLIEQLQNS